MLYTETVPSSFLPHLPKSQYTLSPLSPQDLLSYIACLRELYIPPIHGGFQAADILDGIEELAAISKDGKAGQEESKWINKATRAKKRERRFSAGLVETMEGMGLGLDVDLSKAGPESLVEAYQEEEMDIQYLDQSFEEEYERPHLESFEREWAERWLGGLVRRSQGWLEENESEGKSEEAKEIEAVLRDATAVLAMMAGTSAAGSLTRHLAFPVTDHLTLALSQSRKSVTNPLHSPTTTTFLASLSTSPTSPITFRQRLASSPTATTSLSRHSKRVLPILLHDAPMSDHESVGVQTWGSAILLARQIALNPFKYGLFLDSRLNRGPRVLELGAGTGLLSILCRKLLDLNAIMKGTDPGLVVATDFLPSVLDNLKVCVDLNFPPVRTQSEIETTHIARDKGIHIAKLDWSTFSENLFNGANRDKEEMSSFMADGPFDLILASDCVYNEFHAKLLRDVARWVLRLPQGDGDIGGTFHILSPLRPTFQPELESIDKHFPPLSSFIPLAERMSAANDASYQIPSNHQGEGLGLEKGLKLGVRGEGKRGIRGRRGEGRIDEAQGYWWWEVGWG
ncbi:hypothetical protein L204_106315 [Cryptococcus depauperatus]|nr:hypothetical protein L204_06291 [Cryptococcus depauperatus CBS 7855]